MDIFRNYYNILENIDGLLIIDADGKIVYEK